MERYWIAAGLTRWSGQQWHMPSPTAGANFRLAKRCPSDVPSSNDGNVCRKIVIWWKEKHNKSILKQSCALYAVFVMLVNKWLWFHERLKVVYGLMYLNWLWLYTKVIPRATVAGKVSLRLPKEDLGSPQTKASFQVHSYLTYSSALPLQMWAIWCGSRFMITDANNLGNLDTYG